MARQVRDFFIDYDSFKKGLYALEDTTKAPFGTARILRNMIIKDSGGLSPRPGIALLGTKSNDIEQTNGVYTFRKSFGQNEILLKPHGTKLEIYSKNHPEAGWFTLKSGFTSDKEFGFTTSLVNTQKEDILIGGNRYEPYFTWTGAITQLNGSLAGGETSVTVDSTLTEEVFFSGTADSATATTIDVTGTPWANDQWNDIFCVYITSGTHIGKIRKITDTDNNTITFNTLGSTPGTCTFEIRQTAFPIDGGTIIYSGTEVAYTGIPTSTTFSVASAHAATDNSGVASAVTTYPGNPRGNRIANYLTRIIVGNVRSGMARGSGGAMQGYASAGSYFVSKLEDPTSFDYSANRVAGEGDVVSLPYGSDITDIVAFEDSVAVFSKNYVELAQYSQDANDLVNRTPLKSGTGSKGRVISGPDDVYFITGDNQFTSLGRVASKDILPQTLNIGTSIKRLLESYVFDKGKGYVYKNKIYIPAKQSSESEKNDIVVVYNMMNKAFDGVWDISADTITEFNGDIVFGDSTSADVFKMLTGTTDTDGEETYPISSEYASHFMNLTSSNASLQALNAMYVEGYIAGDTQVTFNIWKDFETEPCVSFTFDAVLDEQFINGEISSAFLGSSPIGLRPMGTVSGTLGDDGRLHFMFRVYFPFQYGNHFSYGFSSSGERVDYEITRLGLSLKETATIDATAIKVL